MVCLMPLKIAASGPRRADGDANDQKAPGDESRCVTEKLVSRGCAQDKPELAPNNRVNDGPI